jgi:ubiquinone/menaquinone biosynthesis C-methylase UbiE
VPDGARYFWLDNDQKKLQGLMSRSKLVDAVLGDATHLCLPDRSIDYILCVAMAHHLTDSQLDTLFSEFSRVIKKKLIFLDPVVNESSIISNLLWKYDRGSHPRKDDELLAIAEKYVEVSQVIDYKVFHRYFLILAEPKYT